jgi:hypothetical protein
MNLFLAFESPQRRDEFLARVRAEDPELLERIYLAKRRPDAIFNSLSGAEAARLRQLVLGLGRAFDDVKFETMAPR